MPIYTKSSCHVRPFFDVPSNYQHSNKFIPVYWKSVSGYVSGKPSPTYMCRIGTDVYYLKSSNEIYKLNRITNIWEKTDFYGFADTDSSYIYGNRFWTDGTNYYYSNANSKTHLVLVEDTWETKTWNGLTDLYGNRVWNDGNNIYYSSGSGQYVLNKDTNTWEVKTWGNSDKIYGEFIWTDGTNFYCSNRNNGKQYVLNKETDTWEEKVWNGVSNPDYERVWTDGTNIYCSDSTTQYILDKETSTWERVSWTWSGTSSFIGNCIWTDGTIIYYSYNSGATQYHYVLLTTTTKFYSRIDGAWVEVASIA